ncbi:MAG: hypothetical protein WA584_14960 [Pyrinomonadaceae bacterium]
MKEFNETNMQTEEPDNPFKEPDQPSAPEPNVPDPYPVSDPINEPEPFPTPPEPIPDLPPDVVF